VSQITTVRTDHPGPAPSAAEYATAGGFAMLIDWGSPMRAPAGARPLEPIVYGTAGPGGRELELYVHRRRDLAERRPGIVFVHGGGWAACGPGLHLRHAYEFAAQGYVTVNITYRLATEATWPAAIDDVMAAIRWVRASAAELGLDPERLAVAGGSAGGHLSAMAALLGGEDPSAAVQAAVLWYPCTDLRSFAADEGRKAMSETLLPGAGTGELLQASPIGNVHAAAPPFLTMTGAADPVTTLDDIERFHEGLSQLGVRNELDVFEGRDHGFDYHPADWVTSIDRMTRFLDEVLGSPT
jgi:acetyl esterase